MLRLRDYQLAAIAAVEGAFADRPVAMLQMATGLGKTVVFAEIVRRRNNGHALVLAHREELVFQAANRLGTSAIEMGPQRAGPSADIVVGTVQTVSRRLRYFPPEQFSLVVVDEAHHAAAGTYRRIIQWFRQNPDCRILGVTATPQRHDGQDLESEFGKPVFRYSLTDGIEDGWLVPVEEFITTDVTVKLENVKVRGGDYALDAIEGQIQDLQNVEAIAKVAADCDGKVLVYTPGVESAIRVCDAINRKVGELAAVVHGGTEREERRRIIDEFRSGKLRYIVNCLVLTEGFDEPTVDTIIMARPTKSRVLYAQVMGRGMRPLPGVTDNAEDATERRLAIAESDKPKLTIIDVNTAGKQAVMAVDLFHERDSKAADYIHRTARRRAKQGPINCQTAVAEADYEYQSHVRYTLSRVQEGGRRAKRRESFIDLLYALGVPIDTKGNKVPPALAVALQNLGLPKSVAENVTLTQCSQIFRIHRNRNAQGLASYKQMRILVSHGLPIAKAITCTRREATKMVAELINSGWKANLRTLGAR